MVTEKFRQREAMAQCPPKYATGFDHYNIENWSPDRITYTFSEIFYRVPEKIGQTREGQINRIGFQGLML